MRLHFVEEGEGERAVLLLHGFPEFWWSWRHQIPSLAARGLRVLALDLRGFGESERPPRVADYDLDVVAADVASLVERECGGAAVVGHDWGGAVAWRVAQRFPERVTRLVALDCPPAEVMGRALVRDPRQLARSRYMLYFQLPWLPERRLRGDGLRRWILGWAHRKEAFDAAALDRFVDAAERGGGLGPGLNYYRAAFRRLGELVRPPPSIAVAAPTLVVWGAEDAILGLDLAHRSAALVAGGARVEVVPGAGHFVQQEAPDAVNRILGEFLA